MKLNPQDLEKIASLTLDHYNQNAEEFWQGARDHDVKQNTALQSSSGECRFNRLGGIHGGKKNAPDDSGAITFSGCVYRKLDSAILVMKAHRELGVT
jgi:hypothetical protein